MYIPPFKLLRDLVIVAVVVVVIFLFYICWYGLLFLLSSFVLGYIGKDKNRDDILLLDDPLRFPNHPLIRLPSQANCFIDMKHNSSGAPPRLLIW